MNQESHEIEVTLTVSTNCDSTIAVEHALQLALPGVAGILCVSGQPAVMFRIVECKTMVRVLA